MSTSNVIELSEAKKQILLKNKEKEFKSYTSSLKQEQLQIEANYLINTLSEQTDELSLLKGAVILDELAKRVTADNIANTINTYASNIRSRLGQLNRQ